MTILMVVGILVGGVLGLRFSVIALGPVLCVGLVIVIVEGIVRGDRLWQIGFAIAMVAVAAQMGYFFGSFWRLADGKRSIPTSA
jgi:hypothetical protein